MSTIALSLVILLAPPIIDNPTGSAAASATLNASPSEAGFTTALFDSGTLLDILKDDGCTGIRFYNVKLSATATDVHVMAIGIDERGVELDGGLFAAPYRIGASGEEVKTVIRYSRSKAIGAFGYLAASGIGNFSASFSRADIQALLGVPGCGALRITPDDANGSATMRLTAIGLDGGTAVDLGKGQYTEKVCGDPCPAYCGPSENYLQVK